MDNYDYSRIDFSKLELLAKDDNFGKMFENATPKTNETPPLPNILIPVGEYDGGDLLPDCTILDNSYIVYLEVENPELI